MLIEFHKGPFQQLCEQTRVDTYGWKSTPSVLLIYRENEHLLISHHIEKKNISRRSPKNVL